MSNITMLVNMEIYTKTKLQRLRDIIVYDQDPIVFNPNN